MLRRGVSFVVAMRVLALRDDDEASDEVYDDDGCHADCLAEAYGQFHLHRFIVECCRALWGACFCSCMGISEPGEQLAGFSLHHLMSLCSLREASQNKNTHIHTYTCTYIHIHMHRHTHTCTHTNTCTDTHTPTHPCTHTHT